MPSWAINGVDIGGYLAFNGVAPAAPVLVGERRLALMGGCRHDVTARKRAWTFRTKVLPQDVAEGIRRLVDGESDCWSFEDSWSAQGTPVTSFSGVSISAAGAKYGTYGLSGDFRLSSAEYAGVLAAGSPWTIMAWRVDGPFASVTHRHWITTSAGGLWVNGVASAIPACVSVNASGKLVINGRDTQESLGAWASGTAFGTGVRISVVVSGTVYIYQATPGGTSGGSAPSWPTTYNATVADNTITWRNDGRGGLRLDDLVLFPFVVPSTWVSQLYTQHAAGAWTAPELLLSGSQVSPSATVRGHFSGAKGVRTTSHGASGETLEFELEER